MSSFYCLRQYHGRRCLCRLVVFWIRHTMVARFTIVVLAIFALAGGALARNRRINVDVRGNARPVKGNSRPTALNNFHKLQQQWNTLKKDCELLYTNYQSQSYDKMNDFKNKIIGLTNRTLQELGPIRRNDEKAKECLGAYAEELRRIEKQKPIDITTHATLIHKFLQGHQIIFNMHLNKTEHYLNELDNTLTVCIQCENKQIVRSLFNEAEKEINHLKNYVSFTTRAFLDIISYYTKVIKEMNKTIQDTKAEVRQNYEACMRERYDAYGRPIGR